MWRGEVVVVVYVCAGARGVSLGERLQPGRQPLSGMTRPAQEPEARRVE